MRRVHSLFFAIAVTASFAASASDRANTLECSDEEVMAYMELADKQRQQQFNFTNFEAAYIVAAEEERTMLEELGEDVGGCMSVLYGDISAMAQNVKDSLSGMSFGIGDIKEAASNALSDLSESICSRIKTASNEFQDELINQRDRFEDDLYREANARFGERAMERFVNDKVLPPEFVEEGLRYRNGGIDSSRFRRKIQSRWRGELEEMEDEVVDGVSGQ